MRPLTLYGVGIFGDADGHTHFSIEKIEALDEEPIQGSRHSYFVIRPGFKVHSDSGGYHRTEAEAREYVKVRLKRSYDINVALISKAKEENERILKSLSRLKEA